MARVSPWCPPMARCASGAFRESAGACAAYRTPGPGRRGSFSPDGERLVTRSSSRHSCDPERGRKTMQPHVFVAMPFGAKEARAATPAAGNTPATGAVIVDFNLVYQRLIAP